MEQATDGRIGGAVFAGIAMPIALHRPQAEQAQLERPAKPVDGRRRVRRLLLELVKAGQSGMNDAKARLHLLPLQLLPLAEAEPAHEALQADARETVDDGRQLQADEQEQQ